MTTCAGCNKQAKYLVYAHLEPHCLEHMLEALCSVPVPVIDIDEYMEVRTHGKDAA